MPEVPLLDGSRNEADEEAGGLIKARYAYLVFCTEEGQIAVSPDINIPLTVEKQPTLQEIKGSASVVLADIAKEETAVLAAQHVLNGQQQMARQMMEQQMNQQALSGKNLRV
jgi:hypothetical protein